jgi:hypothetical protein
MTVQNISASVLALALEQVVFASHLAPLIPAQAGIQKVQEIRL